MRAGESETNGLFVLRCVYITNFNFCRGVSDGHLIRRNRERELKATDVLVLTLGGVAHPREHLDLDPRGDRYVNARHLHLPAEACVGVEFAPVQCHHEDTHTILALGGGGGERERERVDEVGVGA